MAKNAISKFDLPPVPYFFRSDYLKSDFEEGTLTTQFGTRVIVLPQELIVGIHRAIEYETGRAWNLVAHTCGRTWGGRVLKTLQNDWRTYYRQQFEQSEFNIFEAWLSEYFKFNGWGELSIDFEHERYGLVQFYLKDSVLSLLLDEELKSDYVNEIFAGLLATMSTWLAGRELDCLEIASTKTGADASRFVVATPEKVDAARRARSQGATPDEMLALLMETKD